MCAFHHSWQPTTSFKLQKSMCMYAWMYVNNCCTYDDSDNKKIGMQLNFYNYQTNKQFFYTMIGIYKYLCNNKET